MFYVPWPEGGIHKSLDQSGREVLRHQKTVAFPVFPLDFRNLYWAWGKTPSINQTALFQLKKKTQ